MPRTVTCPVARWPGEVVLAEPLSWPQYLAWQRATLDASAVVDAGKTLAEWYAAYLPCVSAIVVEWRLRGLNPPTADGIPATPIQDACALLAWLVREIRAVVVGEDSPDPKAFGQ